MCGIAGIVTRDGSPPNEGILRRMSESIAHRGPDGAGAWSAPGIGLAHRRLAIIDLSPSAAQPMHDASGKLTIVFNGEIYNYLELRRELEAKGVAFRTHSDTEVILEAYRAWGSDAFARLRGMFALAIWDAAARRLILARDKVGKKPLFYATTPDGHLAFASEIKALHAAVDLKPDWNDVRTFLGLQYVPTPRTGFVGVSQLGAGHVAQFENGTLTSHPYHMWPRETCELSDERVFDGIRTRLDDAVKMRVLASDVPVGAFLSGGIDSAAVVKIASNYSKNLSTYTMGFPSFKMDERREADAISKKIGTNHHEFVAQPEQLAVLLDDIVAQYDAPYADSSALPLWLLAKETAKEIKVVLTGDGGDELFGGYRRYVAYQRALMLARLPFSASASRAWGRILNDPRYERMAATIGAFPDQPGRAYGELFCSSYFSTVQASKILSKEFQDFLKSKTRNDDPVTFVASQMADASLDSAMRFDFISYLADDLNVKMDRATMRFGLEARSPFLDSELATFALSLPTRLKVRGGKTKIALKMSLAGILPDDVLNRKKRGFQVPLAEWFRGPLAFLLKERLLDPSLPISRIINPDAVHRLIAENARGTDHGNRLWMLLSLSTWLTLHS